MVRKPQILAAAVQVDRLAEVLLRHDRALEVPAGEAPAEGRVPLHEVRVVLFPEREVARVALAVVLYGIADVLRKAIRIRVARELSVVLEPGHMKINAVGRLVGVARGDERLDGADLLADVLGRARADVGLDQSERAPVGEEGVGVVPCEVPHVGESLALLARERLLHLVLALRVGHVVVREVPDVRHVAHVADVPAERRGRAHDEIRGQEGPEVADVGVRVDRRPAGVEPQQGAAVGRKRRGLDGLDLPGERVREAERRAVGGVVGGHRAGRGRRPQATRAPARLSRSAPRR